MSAGDLRSRQVFRAEGDAADDVRQMAWRLSVKENRRVTYGEVLRRAVALLKEKLIEEDHA